jgi:hypothetical protein
MFINMLEFLIDNIFVFFGGRVFQQTVDIPMGTNCAPIFHLFCRKVSFLTAPHCQFRGVGQGMKQTYLYLLYPLFQLNAAAPAYGVYISQLIRYFRACGSYQDFLDRGLLLTRKLLNQGFLLVKLK